MPVVESASLLGVRGRDTRPASPDYHQFEVPSDGYVSDLIFFSSQFYVTTFAVHCGSIRQTASIISMSQECLRTGDKALIHFRFIKYPEYMVPGQRMVFREGRTKAVGNVVKIYTHIPVSQIGTKSKTSKQQQHYRPQPSSGGKLSNANHFVNSVQMAHNAGQSLQQVFIVLCCVGF